MPLRTSSHLCARSRCRTRHPYTLVFLLRKYEWFLFLFNKRGGTWIVANNKQITVYIYTQFCSSLPAFVLLHIKAYGLCECVDTAHTIYVVNHSCVSIAPKWSQRERRTFGLEKITDVHVAFSFERAKRDFPSHQPRTNVFQWNTIAADVMNSLCRFSGAIFGNEKWNCRLSNTEIRMFNRSTDGKIRIFISLKKPSPQLFDSITCLVQFNLHFPDTSRCYEEECLFMVPF